MEGGSAIRIQPIGGMYECKKEICVGGVSFCIALVHILPVHFSLSTYIELCQFFQ